MTPRPAGRLHHTAEGRDLVLVMLAQTSSMPAGRSGLQVSRLERPYLPQDIVGHR